jgi:hypothetical protein
MKLGDRTEIIHVWLCDIFFVAWDVCDTTIEFTWLIGTLNIAQRLILGRHPF